MTDIVDEGFAPYDEAVLPVRSSGFLGRRGTQHEPSLLLHNFRTTQPVIPDIADFTMGRLSWGMLGNDQFGDCGPAATEHARMVKAMARFVTEANGSQHPVYEPRFRCPHTPYTLDIYWEYGRAQGESGAHPDQGVYLRDWLTWLYQHKIIEGFAEVDGNPTSVTPDGLTWRQRIDEATSTFHGALVGVSLTPNAEGRFMRMLPWSVGPNEQPDPNLGHAIYRAQYDPKGCTYITWGASQRATVAWEQACADEYWVILTKEDADRSGVDWAALTAALDALPLATLNAQATTATTPLHSIVHEVESIPVKLEHEISRLWDRTTPREQFIARELVRVLERAVEGTPEGQLIADIEQLVQVLK